MKAIFYTVFAFCAAVYAQDVPSPAAKQSTPIYIKSGTFHLGNGQILEGGGMLLEEGKIKAIGSNVSVPAQAKVIDASGKQIYPGFITVNSGLGLEEVEAVRATLDRREVGANNANARALSAYNTDSRVTPTVRSNGILIAQIAPDGGSFSGTSSIVELDAWSWEEAALKADDALYLNWPDQSINPNGNIEEQRKAIEKRESAIHQVMRDAQAYRKALQARENITHNLALEALIPVLSGEKKLFIRANSEKQIVAAVSFAQQYNLKIVIVGGQDAWLQTDLLKQNKIPVVLYKSHHLPLREDDPADLPYRLPKILADAGIPFCFTMDVFWNERNLPFIAGTAAAYGLNKEQAISALSAYPAEILGIADRVGTLEVGKDATFILSEGDVLDIKTSAIRQAFIQGREISLDNMQEQLYHKFQAKYTK